MFSDFKDNELQINMCALGNPAMVKAVLPTLSIYNSCTESEPSLFIMTIGLLRTVIKVKAGTLERFNDDILQLIQFNTFIIGKEDMLNKFKIGLFPRFILVTFSPDMLKWLTIILPFSRFKLPPNESKLLPTMLITGL
jgi:hypothetical protein